MEKAIIRDKNSESLYDDIHVYQFTEKEFNLVFPTCIKQIERKISSLEKKVEYYEGLREANATEKQLDKWFEYTEVLDFFKELKSQIIKNCKK